MSRGWPGRSRSGAVRRADPEKFAPGLLGQGACSGHPGVYLGERRLLLREITEAALAARIAACLPDAKISVEKTGSWGLEQTIVHGSRLVFTLDESGTARSHVGRTLFITIRAGAEGARALD